MDEGLVESSLGAVFEFLDAGALADAGAPQASFKEPVVAVEALGLNEICEPFLERGANPGRVLELLFEGLVLIA